VLVGFALAAGLGAVLLSGPGGTAGQFLPSAGAAPDPCTASEVAKTVAMVATHTGNYLEANPRANQTITAISKQGGPESIAGLKSYFDANPKVAGDLQRLQQPLAALSGECKLPISLPQVFGLIQTAQQSPALPASPFGGTFS
jgi:hemophore